MVGALLVSVRGQVEAVAPLLGGMSVVLALTNDLAALLALNELMSTRRRDVRRWAWAVLVLAGGTAAGLNTWHAVEAGKLPPVWAVVVGIGPVLLAVVLSHLVALVLGEAPAAPSTATPAAPPVVTAEAVVARPAPAQPAPVAVESSRAAQAPTEALSGPGVHHGLAVVPAPARPQPGPTVAAAASVSTRPPAEQGMDRRVERLAAQLRTGTDLTGASVAEQLGCSPHGAATAAPSRGTRGSPDDDDDGLAGARDGMTSEGRRMPRTTGRRAGSTASGPALFVKALRAVCPWSYGDQRLIRGSRVMGQHKTDADVRVTHRSLIVAGAGLGLAGVVLDVVPLLAGSVAFGAAAKTGYILALLLIGGTLTHRWWYFHPTRAFRRELGGPDGWLDRHDLARTAGEEGVRAAAPPGSGSGAGAPVTDYGWQVGRLECGGPRVRLVWWPRAWRPGRWLANWRPRPRPVFSPWARGFGVVGPQGSGKTQFLVNVVLDSPGAAVVPSTKPELVMLTRELRERVGPTAVFNPSLLGTIGSDFSWDPVSGCTDQGIADRRAWALVRGSGGASGIDRADFWAGKAQEILRCYLLAAAVARADMAVVMRWANNPDDREPVSILEAYPQVTPHGWLPTLLTHLRASANTRTGYFATVTSCVGFMDSPTVAAACRPGSGGAFNVEAFLRWHGTLYLVGGAGDKRLAPLLTALTEYVFDEAQRIAAQCPGGRLSPTLNFILDEVANTTPVPLDRWAADSRGWGITVGAVVQSLAQFATTWGRDRAEVIWENLPTKIVLPGVNKQEDLRALSYLAGERWVQRTTRGESESADGRASRSTSRTPTLEPVVAGHTIASMPRWHAFVLGLGRHPAIVSYTPGYERVAAEQQAMHEARAAAAPVGPTGPDPRVGQVVQLPTTRGRTR